MKQSDVKTGNYALTDSAGPQSVWYYIILAEQQAQFVRATAGRFDILLSVDATTSRLEELDRFITILSRSSWYYGRPLTVLLNNERVFTFFKEIDSNKPQAVLEDLRSLRCDEVQLIHSVEKYQSGKFLVAQGIDLAYLDSLGKLLADGRLRVSSVHTLGVCLFTKVMRSAPESAALHLFDFESFSSVLIRDNLGRFIYLNNIAKDIGISYDRLLEETAGDYLGDEQSLPFHVYINNAKAGLSKAGYQLEPLSGRFGRPPDMMPPGWGRLAKGLSVALNSAKLLVWTLLLVATLSCLAASVTFLMSSDDDTTIATYQEKYASKLQLGRRLDSLRSIETAQNQRHVSGFRSANVISAFCQSRFGGLHLERIIVRRLGGDTSMVEIDGKSNRETRVFQYHRLLDSLMHPYSLSISSIVPNITSWRGHVDTSFDFKLSAVLDGR